MTLPLGIYKTLPLGIGITSPIGMSLALGIGTSYLHSDISAPHILVLKQLMKKRLKYHLSIITQRSSSSMFEVSDFGVRVRIKGN